jgi:predicted DNA binding CopG/RHH family protein
MEEKKRIRIFIQVPVSAELHETIEQKVTDEGRTMAGYIRMLINKDLKEAEKNEQVSSHERRPT